MTCKSCGKDEIYYRKLCKVCTGDYRYNMYRRWLEKKQTALGLTISDQWARKPRATK